MGVDLDIVFGILAVAVGLGFVIFGVIHEVTWFRRRGWFLSKGKVIGYEGSGKDGVKYPVIEYQTEQGSKAFVSKYGGGKPPAVGKEVKVAHDCEMKTEEHFTVSNRILFTVLFVATGLIITSLGWFALERIDSEEVEITHTSSVEE